MNSVVELATHCNALDGGAQGKENRDAQAVVGPEHPKGSDSAMIADS